MVINLKPKKPIIEDCAGRIVLLKLTTDRHEASRGLVATAEFLVNNNKIMTTTTTTTIKYENKLNYDCN